MLLESHQKHLKPCSFTKSSFRGPPTPNPVIPCQFPVIFRHLLSISRQYPVNIPSLPIISVNVSSTSRHYPSFSIIPSHFHLFYTICNSQSFPIISHHFQSFPIISSHFPSFPVISSHFPSFPVISLHFPSSHGK